MKCRCGNEARYGADSPTGWQTTCSLCAMVAQQAGWRTIRWADHPELSLRALMINATIESVVHQTTESAQQTMRRVMNDVLPCSHYPPEE